MDYIEIWKAALDKIKSLYFLSSGNYATLIEVLKPIGIKDNKLILMAPNRFTINILNVKVLDHIENAVNSAEAGLGVLIIGPDEEEHYKKLLGVSVVRQMPIDFIKPNLDPRYTFENFITGDSNSFAHATAWAISQSPGTVFNPFFIYGKSGLGKTHLMQAIGHEVIKRFPEKKVTYVSSERFTNELIASIRNSRDSNRNEEFKETYRNLDLLMIDDVQFFQRKEVVQEEFFHTFNALKNRGAQIVMASDRLPKEIEMVQERLINRFESGIVADITMPNLETKVAILQKKAEFNKFDIPSEIIWYIAESVTTSIRELEGALTRTVAKSLMLDKKSISLIQWENIASQVLNEMKMDAIKNTTISVEEVIEKVADSFNLSYDDIVGSSRESKISLARHVAMYITRQLTNVSYPTIGSAFGRDHSSVIYACDKIKKSTAKDLNLKRKIQMLTREIKNSH